MPDLANGVTAFLPTTMTVSVAELEAAFEAARKVKNRQNGEAKFGNSTATVIGVHAEGPFIAMAKKGAQNPKYIINPPDAEFVKKHSDIIKMITIAPETDDNCKAIREITSETGVIVSAGHTTADYETMQKAIDAGVTHATHLFNAMPSISHREPGGTTALLFSDKVSCELICDGIHVHKGWFEPVYRIKKNKLNRGNGKFRRKTIDYIDELFASASTALGVTKSAAEPSEIAAEPKKSVPATQPTQPKEGYVAFAADKVPSTVLQMLPESEMQVATADQPGTKETQAIWKGTGNMFGKSIASLSIAPTSEVYKAIGENGIYNLSFFKKGENEDAWLIIECRKQGETQEGNQVTVIGEILNVWMK